MSQSLSIPISWKSWTWVIGLNANNSRLDKTCGHNSVFKKQMTYKNLQFIITGEYSIMKKSISLFFALLIALSSALVGCSDGAETSGNNETPSSAEISAPENETAETETAETEAGLTRDDLPDDLDFDGETITIHIRNGDNGNPEGNCVMEMTVEELNGELLNDAIYNRNLAVNERLNVQIDPYVSYDWTGYGNCLAEIRASINANEKRKIF